MYLGRVSSRGVGIPQGMRTGILQADLHIGTGTCSWRIHTHRCLENTKNETHKMTTITVLLTGVLYFMQLLSYHF